jgi:hypothetical protein
VSVGRQETEAWRQEFQSTLTQIDETGRMAKPSTLKVETPPESEVALPGKVVIPARSHSRTDAL